MDDERFDNEMFDAPVDLEEERRKYEAADILYRAIKYVIGYLKGYRVEKQENLESNPMWVIIKVWWKTEDINKDIQRIEEEIKRMVEEREEEMKKDAEKYAYDPLDEQFHVGD